MNKSEILDELFDIKTTLDIWVGLGGDCSNKDLSTIRDRIKKILGDVKKC